MRRFTGQWMRFPQPDPYDGASDLSDPQSFNRYSYVNNDPVNFVDPTGLDYGLQWTPPDNLPPLPTNALPVSGILGNETGIAIVDPPTTETPAGGGPEPSAENPQQPNCGSVAGLMPATTDEGALSRLIFAEATSVSQIGFGQPQADEVNAIAASVRNRAVSSVNRG